VEYETRLPRNQGDEQRFLAFVVYAMRACTPFFLTPAANESTMTHFFQMANDPNEQVDETSKRGRGSISKFFSNPILRTFQLLSLARIGALAELGSR